MKKVSSLSSIVTGLAIFISLILIPVILLTGCGSIFLHAFMVRPIPYLLGNRFVHYGLWGVLIVFTTLNAYIIVPSQMLNVILYDGC